MHRISLYLAPKALAALKALSERTGLSYAEHIRRAVDAYLKQTKEPK